jgi:hypothetical protein
MEIPDTLGFLLRTWDLSRSYTDHRHGATAAFQGQAVLATDSAAGPDLAQYEESTLAAASSSLAPVFKPSDLPSDYDPSLRQTHPHDPRLY